MPTPPYILDGWPVPVNWLAPPGLPGAVGAVDGQGEPVMGTLDAAAPSASPASSLPAPPARGLTAAQAVRPGAMPPPPIPVVHPLPAFGFAQAPGHVWSWLAGLLVGGLAVAVGFLAAGRRGD